MEKELVKKMRQRMQRMENQGDYWSTEDHEELSKCFHEGIGISEMALLFQRTEPAIMQQIEKLDLYNRKEAPSRRKSHPKEPACLCTACTVDPALCPMNEHCPKSKKDV